MPRHYLDYASTAPLRPEAAEAMGRWIEGTFADPGRIHQEATTVRAAIEHAREQVAGLLGVKPRQVIFTSGATEAVNAAVWGATRTRPGAAVICAAVEHSSVREASERLAPTEPLAVDSTGRIEAASLDDALAAARRRVPSPSSKGVSTGDGSRVGAVALVHCQWANHEVGTLQPVAEVVERCRQEGIPVHVDAAAACGQVALDLGALGAELVSVSAHKLGGPPGVGALVVGRGRRLEPLLLGGQQERARRAGMENVPGIVGFGAAAEALAADGAARLHREAAEARRRVADVSTAAEAVPGVAPVGPGDPSQRLPHLACFGVTGVEAEPVLLGLDRAGIAAHSGSACSSELLAPSPVLEAMGVDPSHSLRLSVGWATTDDDVAAFASAFPEVVAGLRALRT